MSLALAIALGTGCWRGGGATASDTPVAEQRALPAVQACPWIMHAPRYQQIRRTLFPACGPAEMSDFLVSCPDGVCPEPCGRGIEEAVNITIKGASAPSERVFVDTFGDPAPPEVRPSDRPGYTSYVFGEKSRLPVWRTDVKRDERGRVSEVVEHSGDVREITTLRYASDGRITHETTKTPEGSRELLYRYDDRGRLTGMTATGVATADDVRALTIDYRDARIAGRTELYRGPDGEDVQVDVTYSYDAAGRPVRIQTDWTSKGTTSSSAVTYDFSCR